MAWHDGYLTGGCQNLSKLRFIIHGWPFTCLEIVSCASQLFRGIMNTQDNFNDWIFWKSAGCSCQNILLVDQTSQACVNYSIGTLNAQEGNMGKVISCIAYSIIFACQLCKQKLVIYDTEPVE